MVGLLLVFDPGPHPPSTVSSTGQRQLKRSRGASPFHQIHCCLLGVSQIKKIYTSLSISEKNRGLWIWETPMPFDCRTVASLWNTLENCFNYLAHSQQADANGVQIPDMHFQLKGYIWSPNIPTEPHQGLIHFAISLFGHLLVFLPPISTLSSPAMPCSKPDRQRVELLKAGGIRYCVHVFPK